MNKSKLQKLCYIVNKRGIHVAESMWVRVSWFSITALRYLWENAHWWKQTMNATFKPGGAGANQNRTGSATLVFSIYPLRINYRIIVVAAAGAEAALWEAPGRDHQPAQRGGHPPPLRELQLPGPEAGGAGLLRREPLLHHEGHQVEDDREGAAGALWGGHCPRRPWHVQQARRVPQKGGK